MIYFSSKRTLLRRNPFWIYQKFDLLPYIRYCSATGYASGSMQIVIGWLTFEFIIHLWKEPHDHDW